MTNRTIPQPGILPKKSRLSVCMIVRDEEKMLPRSLKSVQSIADELIVVDTGSKDNTISIAKDFGAKIFHFKWRDDFAAARNESLKHATGDWILQMDADEELLSNSIRPLRESILNPWCLLYDITLDNGPTYPERFLKPARLFRNHPQIRYSEPYHETIRSSVRNLRTAEPRWQIIHEPKIVVRHYGWDKSQMKGQKRPRELRILESYVKDNPNHQRLATRLGEVYVCMERYDEAIGLCKKVLAINPDYAPAHHVLGSAYLEKGIFDEAIVAFEQALAIDPNLGFAHYGLGAAYTNKSMFDEAIFELNRALGIQPDFALAYYWLGVAYGQKGIFDEAIVAFEQALAIDPKAHDMLPYNLAKTHANLGASFHMKGMLEEAIGEYRHALAINPEDAETHYNMGIAYRDKGMLDEAITKYKDALAVNAHLAQAHNNLAVLYYLKKQYGLALKHCDKAIELGFEVHPQLLQDLKPYR